MATQAPPDWATDKASATPDWAKAETPDWAQDKTIPTYPDTGSDKTPPTGQSMFHRGTEQSTIYGGPPKQIAPMSEAVDYLSGAATNPLVKIPDMEKKPTDSPWVATGKDVYNLAKSIPEFMESPLGIGTAGAGVAGAGVKVGLAFGATFLAQLGKQVYQSYKDWDKMTTIQKAEAVRDMYTSGLFSALMFKAAIPAKMKQVAPATAAEMAKTAAVPPKPAETITAAAVKTPEGLVTAPNHPAAEAAAGMPETTREERNTPQYGFQTTKQEFVPRGTAEEIAKQSGQLLKQPETPGQPHSDEIAATPGGTKPLGESNVPIKRGGFEKQDYSPEDLAKYQEATKKFSEFVAKGDVTSPEFQANFKAFEDVRNKYGGMPPKNLEENKAAPTSSEPPSQSSVPATGAVLDEGKTKQVKPSISKSALKPSKVNKTKETAAPAGRATPVQEPKPAAVTAPTIKSPLQAFGKSWYKNMEGAWRQKGKPSGTVNQSTVEALEQLTKPKEPEMVGMGAPKTGEVEGGSGADIHGIAQRVREERAKAGQTVAIAPGEGVSDVQAIQHGEELLGKDPDAAQNALDKFTKDRSISYDSFAAVRAKSESIAQSGRRIEEKFGTESPEYLNALDSLVSGKRRPRRCRPSGTRLAWASNWPLILIPATP